MSLLLYRRQIKQISVSLDINGIRYTLFYSILLLAMHVHCDLKDLLSNPIVCPIDWLLIRLVDFQNEYTSVPFTFQRSVSIFPFLSVFPLQCRTFRLMCKGRWIYISDNSWVYAMVSHLIVYHPILAIWVKLMFCIG